MFSLSNQDLVQVQALHPAEHEVFHRFLRSLDANHVDTGNWELFNKHKAICLVRFLRARAWDVNKTYQMFVQCLEWRKQEGIDEIENRVAHNENASMLLQSYPGTLHGEDREGIPFYMENFGSVDVRQVFAAIPNEVDWMVHHIIQLEDACMRSAEAYTRQNKLFDGINVIVNMQGLSFRHWYLPAVHILKKILAIDMNYYPELLKHVYVVNAPSVFWVIWKLVKPMMDSRTAEKMTVAGDLSPLQQNIDPKYLSELYGKPCTCPIGRIKCGGVFTISNNHSKVDHEAAAVVVGRASVHEIPIVVEAGFLLRWEFSVEQFDVSFGVMCETGNLVRKVMVPFKKVDAQDHTVGGECIIWRAGKYVLMWDNSQSLIRSKKIFVKYSVIEYETNEETAATTLHALLSQMQAF